jgi:soluble lytic murein transglycosylase-like protein
VRTGLLRRLLPAILAGVVAVPAAPRLHAAEYVTLSNGFELTCDHRGQAPAEADPGAMPFASAAGGAADEHAPTRVRLYLDASGANYLDVAPADIVASAPAPATPAPATPAVAPGAKDQPAPTAHPDLSPAELRQILTRAGTEHNLDVDLLASVVQAESGSHPRAVSRTGAQGLMQLMPATAAELGVRDSFAPDANVHGGTAYLDSLLKRYHDNLVLALAAYNAGPAAVDRFHGVPPYRETRAYVARIIHEFNKRYTARQAAAGLAMSR